MSEKIINILTAEWDGGYRLRLHFDDDTRQSVDFRPFLERSGHPAIRAYLQPERFRTFRLEYGELVWGDYELCFPMMDLYLNRVGGAEPVAEAA